MDGYVEAKMFLVVLERLNDFRISGTGAKLDLLLDLYSINKKKTNGWRI
jgi:hypothetical protein